MGLTMGHTMQIMVMVIINRLQVIMHLTLQPILNILFKDFQSEEDHKLTKSNRSSVTHSYRNSLDFLTIPDQFVTSTTICQFDHPSMFHMLNTTLNLDQASTQSHKHRRRSLLLPPARTWPNSLRKMSISLH